MRLQQPCCGLAKSRAAELQPSNTVHRQMLHPQPASRHQQDPAMKLTAGPGLSPPQQHPAQEGLGEVRSTLQPTETSPMGCSSSCLLPRPFSQLLHSSATCLPPLLLNQHVIIAVHQFSFLTTTLLFTFPVIHLLVLHQAQHV